MYSDNVKGADNQQERLIRLGWVLGFVDGEGCFSLGLVRQPSRDHRVGYRAGYQVFHEFVVTQGERSVQCLHDLREFFGVGSVVMTRRNEGRREPVQLCTARIMIVIGRAGGAHRMDKAIDQEQQPVPRRE